LPLALIVLAWAGGAGAQQPPPDAVETAASAYLAFRADAAALAADKLEAPGAMEAALERLARHSPDQLSRGWIAYGALRAADSPAFKAGINSVVTRYGRTAVLDALAHDAAYPSRRRGYGEAIGLTLDSAVDSRTDARAAAKLFESAAGARTLRWTADISNEGRVSSLRALGTVRTAWPIAPLGAPPLRDAKLRLAPAYSTTARRMTTLAGMHLLSARGGWDKHIERLLDDKPTRECVVAERLQFLQCVSVVRDANEAASCIAEHALRGPGSCFGKIAR
jgi:hypothetical protein